MPATVTTDVYRKLTQAELLTELRIRFGDDTERWASRCPSCSDTSTVADWRQALTDHVITAEDGTRVTEPSQLIGQQCIGRVLGALEGRKDEYTGRGCTRDAYGFFKGPWEVVEAGEDGKASGWMFPLADGDDPLTAVHRYTPRRYGKLDVPGTMLVRVPDSHANWGRSGDPVVVRTLRISKMCHCGAERGEPKLMSRCADGQYYNVDEWENACGHIDGYETLLQKAGLVPPPA
jgi:hypothetical protein